jgi:hypothetical protein
MTTEDPMLIKVSKCCKARLLHEGIGNLAVWREVKGRKIYSVRCEKCTRMYPHDGGKAS